MSESIKVVSFNIEFCASVTKGYWQYIEFLWKYFLPHNRNAIYEIVDVINDNGITIATFTEMEGTSYRTRHTDYINTISQLTPLKKGIFFPVNRLFRIGNRGNGIATKYALLSTENIKLKTRMEHRYLSMSKIRVGDETVTILTTQLALGRRSRDSELSEIRDIINSIKGPLIFTGDLNTQKEEELKILSETRLRRIDYIFYSPEFVVVESYVHDKLRVSDHLPVIAELKLVR